MTITYRGQLQTIRERYGMSKSSGARQVINRAIRESVPGGKECLEALDHFGKLRKSLASDRRAHVENIQQMIELVGVILDRLHTIRDAMADAVLTGHGSS